MFNEGYMEDLFNKLKAQIEKLGEKKWQLLYLGYLEDLILRK
jgi:hypothetical protein